MRYEPISLGWDCSQKFQICRSLYQRAHPDAPLDRLREAISSGAASKIFPRLPFDSQVTPIAALIAYIEQDFRGVFERDDFEVHPNGYVVHRTLLTQHPHEFPPIDGRIDQDTIDAQYPAARARFEHLATRFRRLYAHPGPFLYVRSEVPWREQVLRIINALSERAPGQTFHLLLTGEKLRDDLDDLGEHVTQGLIAPAAGKPDHLRWEGDDESWERALGGFEIGLLRGPAFTANFNRIEDMTARALQGVSLEWRLSTNDRSVRELPVTVEIPQMAWAFGALSEPVDGLIEPSGGVRNLVLQVEALGGHVGVGLVRDDLSAMIGREYRLSREDGLINLSLPLTAGMEPARVVLRNHPQTGGEAPGAVRVHAVSLTD